MKVLLLNPPGKNIYVRNYYCSSTSKTNYLFHPIDLVMLSGRLAAWNNNLSFLDSIAERLSPEDSLNKIIKMRPDAIIALTGSVSWNEDLAFFNKLKQKLPGTCILVGGDVFFDNPENILRKCRSISAIYFDFVSEDINYFLRKEFSRIKNMAFRKNGELVLKRHKPGKDVLANFPIPKQELFISKNYRFPFVKRYPFATVLTNFGCPYKCSFCIGGNIGFSARDSGNVMKELMLLVKLGVKEIFFEDYTFGIPQKMIMQLLDEIIENDLGISWTCFSRVDVLKEEMLDRMKKAGCHTIIFGVESGNESMLKLYNKGYTKSQIISTFKQCKRLGIRTVGTFILGLPEETRDTCLETIHFAKELDCDFASFNVAVPRAGTKLREKSIKENLIEEDVINFDHSGDEIAMSTNSLSKEEMLQLKRLAIRKFYFRPKYILKRLKNLSSFTELREQISECWSLFKKN